MNIITASSQNHYFTLIQFIHTFVQHMSPNDKLIVYNLGITSYNWETLQQIFFKNTNIVYRTFDYSKYPEYVNIEKNCVEYAWKPLLIQEVCDQYGENIYIWMDSGNLINGPLNSLQHHIRENGLYSPCSACVIRDWTHPKTIEYMNPADTEKNNRNGAILGFDTCKKWVQNFIREWHNLALIKECISPEGSSRTNHRQDQSVFTILYYKYQDIHHFSMEESHFGLDIHKDISNKKIVIQTWTHDVCNLQRDTTHNFWGLGDLVRGTIHLYQLSKKYDFDLIVDIQQHPLSFHLKNIVYPYSSLIEYNKNHIEFHNNIESQLSDEKSIQYFLTNDHYSEPITSDCQEFIRGILSPNDELENIIREKLLPLQNSPYSIVHFRLGDDEMVRKNSLNDNYEKYLTIIREKREVTDIFMSDSQNLKEKVREEDPSFFMFDVQIGHIGYHSDHLLRDSLFEFFVLTRAQQIKSYTNMSWTSGFVNTAHIIYNVPLVLLK
jgi:hypothetical protein